jgi:hypothetical protein
MAMAMKGTVQAARLKPLAVGDEIFSPYFFWKWRGSRCATPGRDLLGDLLLQGIDDPQFRWLQE